MEPVYRTYAKQMLDVDELPEALEEKLAIAEGLVKKVKPYGTLSSTQTIASIIMVWEIEQLLELHDEGYDI
jgi:hypothetical protein